MDISVIIPVFNEEAIIDEIYKRLSTTLAPLAINYELVFVDDGSKDRTLEKISALAEKYNTVKYISFSRNFGHQVALTAGLEHVTGEAVVIIDGDLQDPPELIPEMYAKYKEGYKVIYAKRKKRKGDSFFKKMTAKLFYRLLKKLTSFDIPLDTGDFRLIDKAVVEALKQMPEQNKFYRGQIAWLGFKQSYVEFERQERFAGETGYPFSKMLKFALDGITAFSDKPLRLVTYIGFFISFLAFLIILYALYSYFILHRAIVGWTSLIISTMFIGGIQLFAIGIIGEYISRLNNNTRNRPLYVVKEKRV